VIDRDAILDAVPSPLVFAQRLGLKIAKKPRPRPERVLVLCAWHTEKNASCVVTWKDRRVVAYCQSCRTGGDALGLFAAVEGLDPKLDFRQVAKGLADLVGVHLEEDERRPVRRRVEPAVDLALRIDAMADRWLEGRELLASDHAAIAAAGPGQVLEALGDLRKADELAAARRAERAAEEAEEDRRRDALLAAMPVEIAA